VIAYHSSLKISHLLTSFAKVSLSDDANMIADFPRQPAIAIFSSDGSSSSTFSDAGLRWVKWRSEVDLDFFTIPHVLERLERTLCHRQLHVYFQRPLGFGYMAKAMPQAHFFKEKRGHGVPFIAV
jgi:hypothetical protein